MDSYSKYKERTPEETVFEIQRILRELDLFPVLKWHDQPFRGAQSNRVTLYPSSLGTNGKGTDELFASASAYGELMERIQNGIVGHIRKPGQSDDFGDWLGFYAFPDERYVAVDEILENPDPLTEVTLSECDVEGRLLHRRFLDNTADLSGRSLVLPFADLTNHKVSWIPWSSAICFCTSNGMAAGNTMEEAMVQAFSEIFERYVNREILTGRAVPPKIPEEELRKYSFYPLIEQIEAAGRYKVTLYDCSLGKNYPVAGICVADLEDNTFGIKLGAHPSLAVSVERTLTEALQGRNIDNFSHINELGPIEQSAHYYNIPNVGKVGMGVYPYTLFTEEPGWEWQPWTRWEGLDNKGFLREMLKIAEDEGWHVLARDCSFLGFPACYIVIPGVSNVYPLSALQIRALITERMMLETWRHFPDLSEEEEGRILRFIQFKDYAVLENRIHIMSHIPLSSRFSSDKIGAFLSLKQGKFDLAERFFRRMELNGEFPDDTAYLRAMRLYAKWRKQGLSGEQAQTLIKELCTKDIAKRVCEDTSDLAHVMQRQFPRLHCFDCKHCDLAGRDCEFPIQRDILRKAFSAFDVNNVSQESLLEFSEGLWE